MKLDAYQVITNNIIESLELGVIPWQKPWSGSNISTSPCNLITKKPYRGINYFMLLAKSYAKGYTSQYWLTWNQVKKKGGFIKKGEKGTPVVWWNISQIKEEENGEVVEKQRLFLKYYSVFNVQQCEGVKYTEPAKVEGLEFTTIEKAEAIINGYKDRPEIQHIEQSAFYRPSCDIINMPKKETFINEEEYYSTMFHELAHSTGHQKRLNREGVANHHMFGSHEYSKEELVAEFTSCFLSGEAGILSKVKDNSTAYIQSWSKKLRQDKKLIISACSNATKASDYILGKKGSPHQ